MTSRRLLSLGDIRIQPIVHDIVLCVEGSQDIIPDPGPIGVGCEVLDCCPSCPKPPFFVEWEVLVLDPVFESLELVPLNLPAAPSTLTLEGFELVRGRLHSTRSTGLIQGLHYNELGWAGGLKPVVRFGKVMRPGTYRVIIEQRVAKSDIVIRQDILRYTLQPCRHDHSSPNIIVTSPAEACINLQNFQITITISDTETKPDPASLHVLWDGNLPTALTWTLVDEGKVLNVSALIDNANQGSHHLYIEVSDHAGNTRTVQRDLTVDLEPPQIIYVPPPNPAPNAYSWNNVPVNFEVHYTDNLCGVEAFGSTPSIPVTEEDEGILVTVWAKDKSGNLATRTIDSISLDMRKPVLTIHPVGNSTARPTIIADYADPTPGLGKKPSGIDTSSFRIFLDGVDRTLEFNLDVQPVDLNRGSVTFSPEFDLSPRTDPYLVRIEVEDIADNVGTATISFTLSSQTMTEIYLADTGTPRIVKIADPQGSSNMAVEATTETIWGSNTPLSFARGVSVNDAGAICVADTPWHRIVEIDDGGWASLPVNYSAENNSLFYLPAVLFKANSGRIFVASQQQLIQMDDIMGAGWVVLETWGPGQGFGKIGGIFVREDAGSDTAIYVTDNSRLLRFAAGTVNDIDPTTSWEERADLGLGLNVGICLDQANRIYLADYDNRRIVMLTSMSDSNPEVLAQIQGGLPFWGPTGVSVDSWGRIYISDNDNGKAGRIVRVGNMQGENPTIYGQLTGINEGVYKQPWGISSRRTERFTISWLP